MRYLDPDGNFQLESSYQKDKAKNGNKRGYQATLTNWNELYRVTVKKPLFYKMNVYSKSNKSRDANIAYDRGEFAPYGNTGYVSLCCYNGVGEKADIKTFEVYIALFGGEYSNGVFTAPKNQDYKTVRSRLGLIFGLIYFQMGALYQYKDEAFLIDEITFDDGIKNLTPEEERLIVDEINKRIKSGEIKYEDQ